jgi:hypothetical protein
VTREIAQQALAAVADQLVKVPPPKLLPRGAAGCLATHMFTQK